MASQAQLLPSLYALLPAEQLDLMLSRLSLQALHVEAYHVRDAVYANSHPVIPGQQRTLRLRGRKRRRKAKSVAQRWAGGGVHETEPVDTWEYTVAWVSPPLTAREYADMRVQAYIGLDVAGRSSREDIEEFVETLGFKHTHTVARLGHLFHLPIPGFAATLHLTVTRVLGDDAPPTRTSEPYLVQMQPGRPVSSVAPRGELTLQDAMRVMQDRAAKIDGLKWETGMNRDTVTVAPRR